MVLLWWSMPASAVALCICGFVSKIILKEHKLEGVAPLVTEPPQANSTPLLIQPPC